MTTAAEYQAKVAKNVTNMDRLDQIVNGSTAVSVSTDSGNVPTVRTILASMQNSAQAVSCATWADLAELTPVFLNQKALVAAADSGTHTGRTADSTSTSISGVPNAGLYGAYALTKGAWRRDGDLVAEGLASVEDGRNGTRDDVAVTPVVLDAVLRSNVEQSTTFTATSGATAVSLDVLRARSHYIALQSDASVSFVVSRVSGLDIGNFIEIFVRVAQSGTHSITWPSNLTWKNGDDATLESNNIFHIVTFNGGTSWHGHRIM